MSIKSLEISRPFAMDSGPVEVFDEVENFTRHREKSRLLRKNGLKPCVPSNPSLIKGENA